MLEDGLGWVTESFFSLAPIHPYPTIAHHSPRGKGAKVAAETLVLLAQESWEAESPDLETGQQTALGPLFLDDTTSALFQTVSPCV